MKPLIKNDCGLVSETIMRILAEKRKRTWWVEGNVIAILDGTRLFYQKLCVKLFLDYTDPDVCRLRSGGICSVPHSVSGSSQDVRRSGIEKL